MSVTQRHKPIRVNYIHTDMNKRTGLTAKQTIRYLRPKRIKHQQKRPHTMQMMMMMMKMTPPRAVMSMMVRVLGYRSRGPGSIPSTTRKKVVGLERGPLSLVSTTEELLDRKVAAPV
jgi:hypothetical protein